MGLLKSRVRSGTYFLTFILAGCGSGSSTPSTPTTPTTPVTESISISTNLDLGSTVATAPCTGVAATCSNGLSLSITVTSNTAVPTAQVYLQLFDSLNRQTASQLSPAVNLAARTPTTFSISSVVLDRTPPVTTTTSRVTVFGANPNNAAPSARQGIIAGSATGGWTFAAPAGGGGSTPTPTPAPTATPQPTPQPTPIPTPSGGIAACSGSRPNASCGLATGQCNNNEFTCSMTRSGTCSSNGGLKCVFCPGPIC